jgi:hypothetical protein
MRRCEPADHRTAWAKRGRGRPPARVGGSNETTKIAIATRALLHTVAAVSAGMLNAVMNNQTPIAVLRKRNRGAEPANAAVTAQSSPVAHVFVN